MGLFKQKTDFDSFVYFAIEQVFNVYDSSKDAFLDKAQWENTYKLTDLERDKLWADFNLFMPIGIAAYAAEYFNGKYDFGEVFNRLLVTYFHFLQKDKGFTEDELVSRSNKVLSYLGKIQEEISKMNEDPGLSVSVGLAFVNIYSRDDRTSEQIINDVQTKSSDKMFTAMKLGKGLLVKDGLLDKIFSDFSVKW